MVDDRMIYGAIIEQVDEAMEFIRKNINVKFVMTGEPEREQVWDYPIDALREAVINALCHRDYTIPSNTEVRIYDDHLRVFSPGQLPLGITLEELKKPHSSHLRNKGVASVFYDIGLIEQWGSGIDKMRDACKAVGLPEPEFTEGQGFSVTFRKDVYTEEHLRNLGLNERQRKAIEYLKVHGEIRLAEFRTICPHAAERTLRKDLADLVELGLVQAIGEKRGRKYIFR